MDPQDTIDFSREAIIMVGIVGGPILAAGLVIGLLVGIFQAMTQIQDQTVSAVPKILGMLLVTMLVLPWVGERMIDYTRETLSTPMIGGAGTAQTTPMTSQSTVALMPNSGSSTFESNSRSPFSLASSSSSQRNDFKELQPDRFAARPTPVAPPLKRSATSMPTLDPLPNSMPNLRSGQQPDAGSSMPQFQQLRRHIEPTANSADLEG